MRRSTDGAAGAESRIRNSGSRIEYLLFWSVALTGLGLFLLARSSMAPSAVAALAWHLGAGAALTVAGVRAAVRREWSRVPAIAIPAAATGLILILLAAAGVSTGRVPLVVVLHILFGFAAVLFAAARGVRATWRPGSLRVSRAAVITALLAVASVALGAVSYRAEVYLNQITATTAAQAGNPLFPSGARIAPDRPWPKRGSESCGEAGCHPREHADWRNSAHAHASDNPAYRSAVSEVIRSSGAESARWCQGCHEPLRTAGLADASVSCLSCHTLRRAPGVIGNGSAVYTAPASYPFAESQSTAGRWAHGFLLRLRPLPHTASFSNRPEEQSGAGRCAPCHRLSVDIAQNRYKRVLYDDTWGEWRASPYSGESAHTFAADVPSRSCASCHFPGSSHSGGRSFADGALGIEVFALRRPPAAPGRPERILAPLTTAGAALARAEEALLDVLVENHGIGHAFPTGVPDIRRAWVSLSISDGSGRLLFASGASGPRGAHTYGMQGIDRNGRALRPGTKGDLVARAYRPPTGSGQGESAHFRALIPGQGDVARYRFRVPESARGPLRITARLQYRRRPSDRNDTILAEHSVAIPISAAAAPRSESPESAGRLYAYGAALLHQKDLPRARWAFRTAAGMSPANPEHHIALGRVFLEEGDLLAARSSFETARKLDPRSARAAAWLGRTLRLMGQYELAVRILEPVARRYPRDPLTWFDIGLCRFQEGRYERAIEAFRRILDIDPDDPAAHLNLMLCYRRLRRVSEARREEAIYSVIRESPPPPGLLETYARLHPDAAFEAAAGHEHVLEALP